MNTTRQPVFVERRRRKDWVVRSVSIIALVGWFCAFAALLIIERAKPETANFFSRLMNYRVRGYWDVMRLRIGIGSLAVSFVTCVTGLAVNKSRHHRKNDRYNKSILILGTITLLLLVFFIRLYNA